MYVLDEPSIGLHQRDNDRLIEHTETPARHWQQRTGGRA
jgi:excinuclease UvrABC ATPase subunit